MLVRFRPVALSSFFIFQSPVFSAPLRTMRVYISPRRGYFLCYSTKQNKQFFRNRNGGKPMWQDYVFGFGQFIMSASLVLMVFHEEKPPLWTSIPHRHWVRRFFFHVRNARSLVFRRLVVDGERALVYARISTFIATESRRLTGLK